MAEFGPAEFLGHRLLTRHQRDRGQVSKTAFHKLWCIADRHLQETFDVDVGLPRFWYKYGEMADEQSINDEFYTAPRASWGGQAYKPIWNLEPADFEITEEERHSIEQTVKWTAMRFSGRDSAFLEAYHYHSHAPNSFIRTYSELRQLLQRVDLDSQGVLDPHVSRADFSGEPNREIIERYLDELVITYPEFDPNFDRFHTLFLRWDDTARMGLAGSRSFDELETFLDAFVEALSKVVLQHKFNQHIPDHRIESWDESRDDAIDEFEAYLEDYRATVLQETEMSGTLHEVAATFDETVLSNLDS